MSKLFADPAERAQALTLTAAVMAHALVSRDAGLDEGPKHVASRAFDYASALIAEAELRAKPPTAV